MYPSITVFGFPESESSDVVGFALSERGDLEVVESLPLFRNDDEEEAAFGSVVNKEDVVGFWGSKEADEELESGSV